LPALYVLVLTVFGGEVRAEHLVIALGVPLLAVAGARGAALHRALLPILITGIGYDCVRYARAAFVTPERVMSCSFKRAELAFFSAGTGETLPEWFLFHHAPVLDLVAAVPYAAFVYLAIGYAVRLAFVDRPRMRLFVWSFALANWISFVTWVTFPVAPPWYLVAHGCQVDLSAAPSAAGLSRVDELLGLSYFSEFYSRAASVFGALPSMHCAYPVLGLLTAWPYAGMRAKAAHVVYTVWMAAAAVYLGHHWVLDVVAGWCTALAGVWLARRIPTSEAACHDRVPSAVRAG
jgi:hypothetical protein